jgi:REP element-mobilizing transposase RayT
MTWSRNFWFTHKAEIGSLCAVRFYPKKRLSHVVPTWVSEGHFFFFTIKGLPPGRNQFCLPETGAAVLAAARFHHEKLTWHCRLMLLMPDHVHAVIAFSRHAAMKRLVSNWKHYLACHHEVVWQESFFDHRLRNHQEEDGKIAYIMMNPIRKGLCDRPEDWPWVYRPNDRRPPITGG